MKSLTLSTCFKSLVWLCGSGMDIGCTQAASWLSRRALSLRAWWSKLQTTNECAKWRSIRAQWISCSQIAHLRTWKAVNYFLEMWFAFLRVPRSHVTWFCWRAALSSTKRCSLASPFQSWKPAFLWLTKSTRTLRQPDTHFSAVLQLYRQDLSATKKCLVWWEALAFWQQRARWCGISCIQRSLSSNFTATRSSLLVFWDSSHLLVSWYRSLKWSSTIWPRHLSSISHWTW